jgi:hypothetical protein
MGEADFAVPFEKYGRRESRFGATNALVPGLRTGIDA